MFNDPLDKQFSKSLLDAARAVNDKTVADSKTAKEDKETLVSDEDMIGQFDEAVKAEDAHDQITVGETKNIGGGRYAHKFAVRFGRAINTRGLTHIHQTAKDTGVGMFRQQIASGLTSKVHHVTITGTKEKLERFLGKMRLIEDVEIKEARSFLKGPQRTYSDPFRPGTALYKALKDVEALGARQRAAREAQTPEDAKAKLAAAKKLKLTNSVDHDADKTKLDEVEMFKRAWDDPSGAKRKMADAYGKSRAGTFFSKKLHDHPVVLKHVDRYRILALAADHALSNAHGTKALRRTTREMHKKLSGEPIRGEIYHEPSTEDIDHAIRHVANARTKNILGKPKIEEVFGWGKKKGGAPALSNNQFTRNEQKRYFNMGADHAEAGSPKRAPATLHPDIRAHYDYGYDTVMSNKKR